MLLLFLSTISRGKSNSPRAGDIIKQLKKQLKGAGPRFFRKPSHAVVELESGAGIGLVGCNRDGYAGLGERIGLNRGLDLLAGRDTFKFLVLGIIGVDVDGKHRAVRRTRTDPDTSTFIGQYWSSS